MANLLFQTNVILFSAITISYFGVSSQSNAARFNDVRVSKVFSFTKKTTIMNQDTLPVTQLVQTTDYLGGEYYAKKIDGHIVELRVNGKTVMPKDFSKFEATIEAIEKAHIAKRQNSILHDSIKLDEYLDHQLKVIKEKKIKRLEALHR